MTCDMSGASDVGPTHSAELAARVFRPEIVANIIDYAADDKRELCRLLKVSKVFYHEATRLLYRSSTVRFYQYTPDRNYPIAPFLIDCGHKRNSFAYIRRLDIQNHCKGSCERVEPFDDETDHTDKRLGKLPNLMDLKFHSSTVEGDCDAEDCPLTRGLRPTGDLTFVILLPERPGAVAVTNLTAAIARLSSSATSVTINLNRNGPAILRKFISIPFGANVTKLTFMFGIEGESGASPELQGAFSHVCEDLVTSLETQQYVSVASITLNIYQLRVECCDDCQENSAETFGAEAGRYKDIWERRSRNLSPTLRSRVTINSFQHTYPEDLFSELYSDEEEDCTDNDGVSEASDEDDDEDEEGEDAEDDEAEGTDESEEGYSDSDEGRGYSDEGEEGYSGEGEGEAYDLDEAEHHDEDEEEDDDDDDGQEDAYDEDEDHDHDHDEENDRDQEEYESSDEDHYDEDSDHD